jgi:hypothetical protein
VCRNTGGKGQSWNAGAACLARSGDEDALTVELDEAVEEKEKLRFIHAVDPSCQPGEM